MMNIPALIGVDMDLEALHTGTEAAVDGFHGEFFVDPSEEVKERIQRKIEEEKEKQELLQQLRGKRKCHKRRKTYQSVCKHWQCSRYGICIGKRCRRYRAVSK